MKTGWIRLRSLLLENTSIVLFIVTFTCFGILSPRFFALQNLVSIVTYSSYVGIVAVGITLVLLTGGIDLSIGANMFLSASLTGILIQNHGYPLWLAVAVGITAGVAFGAFNAFLITNLSVMPFLATLATQIAGRGLTLLMTKSRAISLPEELLRIGSTKIAWIPLPIVFFLAVILVSHVVLRRTALGRQIYAVGYSAEESRKAGINPRTVYWAVYLLSGFFAGVGGIISVAQQGIVNAGFAEGVEFDAVAASVLGGTSLYGGVGNVFPGAFIGTIFIQMVQAGLVYLQVDLYVQPIVSALIILLAVFIDSLRNDRKVKLEQRSIRVEGKTPRGREPAAGTRAGT
jgi:ribose transport system permease protein